MMTNRAVNVIERPIDSQLRKFVSNNRFKDVTRVCLQHNANAGLNDGELLLVSATLGYANMIILLGKLGADLPAKIRQCYAELQAKGHIKAAERIAQEIERLEQEGKLE